MKIIKKIDCLNMIANGNGPERFISDNCLWYKGKSDKEHYYCEGGRCQLNFITLDELNDEIELFEEEDEYEPFEEDKEIEKCKNYNQFDDIDDYADYLRTKIDEIIDYLMEEK